MNYVTHSLLMAGGRDAWPERALPHQDASDGELVKSHYDRPFIDSSCSGHGKSVCPLGDDDPNLALAKASIFR